MTDLEEAFEWIQCATRGDKPIGRGGHTVTAIASKYIVIFAGANRTGEHFNDTYALNTDDMIWSRISTKGGSPNPRSGHTATAIGDKSKMIVFGGQDSSNHFNDVQILSVTSSEDGKDEWAWNCVNCTGDIPEGRNSHTAVFYEANNSLYIFGGANNTGPLDHVYRLDTESFVWHKVETTGEKPVAREMHSAVLLDGHIMMVYGGRGEAGLLTDIALLDLRTNEWVIQKVVYEAPRCAHTATLVAGSSDPYRVALVGGFEGDALSENGFLVRTRTSKTEDIKSNKVEWTVDVIRGDGDGPCRRFAHAATDFDNSHCVYVFGGVNESEDLNDLHCLARSQTPKSNKQQVTSPSRKRKQE